MFDVCFLRIGPAGLAVFGEVKGCPKSPVSKTRFSVLPIINHYCCFHQVYR